MAISARGSKQDSAFPGSTVLSGALRLFSGLLLAAALACGGTSTPSKGDPIPPAVAPTITAQPLAKTVVAGEAATFTVTATGTAPLHYAWKKDGAAVGTDAATCTIATAQPAHAGVYAVTVTNAAGSATSQAASLTVHHITLTAQPQPQSVNEGNQATFQVAATGVPASLAYQWQRLANGTWHDIPNAAEATYTTPSALTLDGGASFRCRVSNTALTVDSDPATLQVNWLHVGTQPSAQAVVTGQGASFSVEASGYPASLMYQWQRFTNGTWANLSGATGSTYGFTTASGDAGAQFRCLITNGVLSVATQPAALTTGYGLAVTITGLPAGVDAKVTVRGPGNFSRTITATETVIVPSSGSHTITAETVEEPGQPPLGDVLSPTEHLARHPWQPVQTVSVSASGSASAEVLYPLPAFTVLVPDAANPGSKVPMDFILVPAGSFSMGSSNSYENTQTYVAIQPVHTVTLTKAFYMSKYSCTQEQWRAVMNTNPAYYTSANGYPDPLELQRPIERVCWDDIRAAGTGYLDTLNNLVPGFGFRLPSEAEYEYATRGGTTTGAFFGKLPIYPFGVGNQYSWGISSGVFRPVGFKLPNPWGLHDVFEKQLADWCEDDFHADYNGAPADGSAWVDSPIRSTSRVTRGKIRTSSGRMWATPANYLGSVGFRMAVGVPVTTNPAGPSLSIAMPGLRNAEYVDWWGHPVEEDTTSGDVTITGPGGFHRHLTAPTTLTGLAEGTYTITPAIVEDTFAPGLGRKHEGLLGPNYMAFHPSQSAITVSVGAGTTCVSTVYPAPVFRPRFRAIDGGIPFINMVHIPFGSFSMGSPDSEPGRSSTEGPQHLVTFPNHFYMTDSEVTQMLWVDVMGSNPSRFQTDPNLPVEQVSWDDVASFLSKLNELTENVRLPGMAYRLPTEAEWEYAARAGNSKPFFWEEGLSTLPIDHYAWYAGNAGSTTHWVSGDWATMADGKAPNAWGLYDMSGNVWEWCQDWFGTFTAEAQTEPMGPEFGAGRVLRGGAYAYEPSFLRSATRAFSASDSKFSNVGFRLVLAGGAPIITTHPVSQTVTAGDDVTFTVVAKGRGPLHYHWKWNLSQIGTDSPTLTLPAIGLSYTGTITVTVSNELCSITSGVASLTVNPPPIKVAPEVTTPPAPQTVRVGNSVTFSVVATGTAPLHYQWQKDGGNVGTDAPQFTIASAQLSDAGQYRVIVTNEVGNWVTGAVPLTVNPAVEITTHPGSLMVAVGDDFTLSVVATGDAPLHYQWKNGTTSVGTDSSQFTLTNAQIADSGSYTVTVSNTKGSATSNPAVVTVTSDPIAPAITTHPVSQSVSAGFGVTFTVTATGTKPLHYQWKKGTTNVGSDSSQFSIASVQPSDAGSYTVTVSNTGGSITSNAADLTVVGAPSFQLPGGITLTLVSVPAGSFTMGSSATEHGTQYAVEGPQHSVNLSAFFMGTYEVTQAQWKAVMGNNPSYYQLSNTAWTPTSGSRTEDLSRPVENVSYFDITTPTTGFLDKLNQLTAATRPAGLVFRLPTEAEWEYACRAGTQTAYFWGDDGYSTQGWSQYVNYAWWPDNSGGVTHGTGDLKTPNAFGLYNTSGNVWEWCQDWFDAAYYASSPATDPMGPASGTERVLRGGDALMLAKYVARSAMRMKWTPDTAYYILGLRVVLGAPRNP